MLSSYAARLALIEALAPTPVLAGQGSFPTLALQRVYDSRQISLSELDGETMALSVYSGDSESQRRGDASAHDDRQSTTRIEMIAEIAVKQQVDGQAFADAKASDDAQADALFSALVGQIQRTLTIGATGKIFRKMTIGQIRSLTVAPDILPELQVRMARRFITLDVETVPEGFAHAAGLPEPLATLNQLLPEGGYAKAQLTQIATMFDEIPLQDLAAIRLQTGSTMPPASGEADTTNN